MLNLKKKAQDTLSLSPIVSGKERVDKTFVIANSPLTLTAIDARTATSTDGSPYNIVFMTFAEHPDKYFSTSTAQACAVYAAWMDECSGDVEALQNAISNDPIHMTFSLAPTKKGNPMLNIEIA